MKAVTAGLLLFTVALGAVLNSWQTELLRSGGPLTRPTRGPGVLLEAFGEGKTLMARYLYFKAEVYHEVLDIQGVPHAKQKDSLPLLRMVTYLDPSLTETFDLIAWDLWRGWGKTNEAIELLREALVSNPASHQLWFRLGFLLFQEKRYDDALEPILKSVEYASKADIYEQLNANRLKFWLGKRVDRLDLQKEAIEVLYSIHPNNILFVREKKRLDELNAEPKSP